MYNNTDRGHTAAAMMHSPERDNDGLPANAVLETGSSFKPEALDRLLRNSLETHGGPHNSGTSHKWLPIDRLFQYVTVSQVYHELLRSLGSKVSSAELTKSQIATWAQRICRQQMYTDSDGNQRVVSCQKIFAILSLLKQVEYAPAFIDSGLTDKHLPLRYAYDKMSDSYELHSNSDYTEELSVFLDWEAQQIDLFDHYQAYMLSPFFELKGNEVPFYDLDSKSVLPFIEDNSNQRRQSGLHGTVYRIKIHPAHHDLHEASPMAP